MSESRKRRDWLVVATLVAAALFLAVPMLYVGGYFALPKTQEFHIADLDEFARIRLFRVEWHCTIYKPAGRVESLIIGRIVEIGRDTTHPEEIDP